MIVSIDGQTIETFADMQRIVSASADHELTFEVDRGGALLTLKVTPARREISDRFGNKLRVGVIGIRRNADPGGVGVQALRADRSRRAGREGDRVHHHAHAVLPGRRRHGAGIGRPDAAGRSASPRSRGRSPALGIVPLLNLTAVLSVSIGLINLFPIPLLDGGHLLFYLIEAVRRRPLSERTQEIGFRIGLAVVLMLMMFATWNDLGIVQAVADGNRLELRQWPC